MYAATASYYVRAYCKANFKKPDTMESTMCRGDFLDVFDITDAQIHSGRQADR